MAAGDTGSTIVYLNLSDGFSIPEGSVAGRVATQLCDALSPLMDEFRGIVVSRDRWRLVINWNVKSFWWSKTDPHCPAGS